MRIRNAKVGDAKRLCELGNRFLEQISNCSPLCKLEELGLTKKNIDSWKKGIRTPEKGSYTFVAEEDGKIFGYVEISIRQNDPKGYFKVKQYGWIDCIAVDEKMRGKGVGQMLFDYAMAFFRKKKLSFVRLSVFLKNKSGMSFWKKNGFSEESLEMIRKV